MARQLQIFAFASALDTWFTAAVNVKLENMDSGQFEGLLSLQKYDVFVAGRREYEHERKEIKNLSEV